MMMMVVVLLGNRLLHMVSLNTSWRQVLRVLLHWTNPSNSGQDLLFFTFSFDIREHLSIIGITVF